MNIGDGQGRGRQCKRKWRCQICLTCCARGLSLRNGLAGPRIIQPKAKAPETDTSGQVVSPLPFAINFHLTMSINAAYANACSMQQLSAAQEGRFGPGQLQIGRDKNQEVFF